jgi:L-amino acid N-acyltransferase YncA
MMMEEGQDRVQASYRENYPRLAQVKAKYDLMVVRDRAFLQWRFRDIPTRQYQTLSARQDGQILGYVVLRQAEVRATLTGMIADFLILPGERGELAGRYLLHEALERFKRAKVPLTGGLMLPHTQEYALMRRAGFLSAPRRFAPQNFHLFVRSYCDEPALDVLVRAQSWYVSIADHDAV